MWPGLSPVVRLADVILLKLQAMIVSGTDRQVPMSHKSYLSDRIKDLQ